MRESLAIAFAPMRIALRDLGSARANANPLIMAALALALAAMAGCSAQSAAPGLAAPLPAPSWRGANPEIPPHVEVASWYGPGFQGHPTSTGERFNEYGMTAASRTLPLGSRVRVTNPANGRSVEVRINDRGPYVRGRSIDLSKGAAERLGMARTGVAPVVVASPEGAPTPNVYSPTRAVVATAYHPAPRAAYAERSRPETAARWKRRWPLWHPTHRVARVYHSRRHSRMVWNPVGAWIASSLPTF